MCRRGVWLVWSGVVLLGGCADSPDVGATGFATTGATTDAMTTTGPPTTSVSATDTNDGSGVTSETIPVGTTTEDPPTGGGSGTESGSSGEPVAPCDQIDDPDPNGIDENEDGIDGLAGCSVFVNATTGSDLNEGLTPDEPLATLDRALELAGSMDPPRDVLVAAATYNEVVNLESGVDLYGGYDPATWDRDVFLNDTTIAGVEDRAVIAQNLGAAVEIDGFTIRGSSFSEMGQSTYAVWVRDVPDGLLTLDYCTIVGGDGGAGAAGANGDPGADGDPGGSAVGSGSGAGGTSSCNAVGGPGGSGAGCPTESGDPGQAGGDSTPIGNGGPQGASHCGSGCDDDGGNGSPGLPGGDGVNGDGGEAAATSAGVFGGDGLWTAGVATDASRGDHGGGGGGGGAGGYDNDPLICDFNGDEHPQGGGGGGGGAAGCGGEPGEAGGVGGATFCIVAIDSSIEVTNTDFVLGIGGAGGDGGIGGDGGLGADPGEGADGNGAGEDPGNGADGGDGGGGGGGGGGSGGCGGPAVGIASVGDTSIALTDVSFTDGTGGDPGEGGAGGLRASVPPLPAEDGATGCDGLVADQLDY